MNTIFCNNCGMIKSQCICNLNKNENSFTPIEQPTSIQKQALQKEHPDIERRIIDNFPFEHARENQLELISEILKAFESGYRYVILEAGTGTGKSAIASCLSQILQPTYILTMTKQLQRQYSDEFGYAEVKGRNNFICTDSDGMNNCELGTCQTINANEEYKCPFGITMNKTTSDDEIENAKFDDLPFSFNGIKKCHYWSQKADAIQSPITLLNYDYAYLELNYVSHFSKRNLMVLDEAHNIENKIMQKLELRITNKQLERDLKRTIPKDMKDYTDIKDWILFLEAIYEEYKMINTDNFSKQRKDQISHTRRKIHEITYNMKSNPYDWIVSTDDESVSFKPLKVDKYAKDLLFKYADHILFMSATILDKSLFCKWLGINEDEVYYIYSKSPFKKENRPIYMKLVGSMAKRALWHTAPRTIPVIEEILHLHENEKGLIHTNSYKLQQYITDRIKQQRILSHNPYSREEVLYEFENSKNPYVLVSPSMSEGVDLPYEKCQFQIIYKIPYPYLGDKQIAKRNEIDHVWYAYKTVITLMQAYGRGMRAKNDHCDTYIIDKNIESILRNKMYNRLIPEFFKEAIIYDN